MNNKLLVGVLLITTLIFAYLYYKETTKFPITRYICAVGYLDCFPVARYEDRDSCEYGGGMSSWRCDSTDKNNIKCYEPSDSAAVGYCR